MVEGPLGWSQGAHAALCGELNTEETEGRFPGVLGNIMDSLVTQMIKNLPTMQETRVQSLDQEEPLEKEIAINSNILAWENPTGPGAWWPAVHEFAESDTTARLTLSSL